MHYYNAKLLHRSTKYEVVVMVSAFHFTIYMYYFNFSNRRYRNPERFFSSLKKTIVLYLVKKLVTFMMIFTNNKLANLVLNGLSVELIYKIVFLENTRLRPLVKITINVSNFLTMYRTIVFFKEEKNLSGLLI